MNRFFASFVFLLAAGPCFSQAMNNVELNTIEIAGQPVQVFGSAYEGLAYKDSVISLTIVARDDSYADSDPWTWRKSFVDMEGEVASGDEISPYFFNMERRVITHGSTTWVDSLVLSMYELEDQQFTRRLITTTGDYFLVVNITMDRPQLYQVYTELPDYFPMRSGYRIWSSLEDAEGMAALIPAGKSGSPTVDEWYRQTEEIVDSLVLR